ncbi:glycosyltransferase [Stratiformator vulcanicus]|uniref:4,4'-diaponeurosporenoate glycosyltransferase n=1 Tax=Stratiformator vulcanicus TaxID=2527980 RepID=A0A517R5W6_9PLAN|nr:glycosyltransferase family 2 protein [Stratiformator vulcanicus]QDT39296.1 4,4'-diaponeurosporenoate glycosyltransferase [Stratiformator vulcanicus]
MSYWMFALAITALVLAAIPALMTAINLCVFHPPKNPDAGARPAGISLLIPARNEERSIEACVETALKSEGVDLEVVVLDDHSEDATANIVGRLAERDDRVRLVSAPTLPEDWCGKQHACFRLSRFATHDRFCFIDADVRIKPGALGAMNAEMERRGVDLLSGFPRQETGTLLEKLLIPLIPFLLMGYLPLPIARRSNWSAFAAGCGQFFLTTRSAYETVGGHEAVKRSLHDGVTLPRAYRRAGLKTDIVDLTPLATCRMYRSNAEVWSGLSKNATEGLASPIGIWVWTFLLAGGFLLPFALRWEPLDCVELPPSDASKEVWDDHQRFLDADKALVLMPQIGVALALLTRLVLAWRFRQSLFAAVTYPVGIATLLVLQWSALVRKLLGRPESWKGRNYTAATSSTQT